MLGIIDPKKKLYLSTILILLTTIGISIIGSIYFYNVKNEKKEKSKEIKIVPEGALFLKKCKEQIDNLEKIVLKEAGDKKFTKNELEYKIATKLANDYNEETGELNYIHGNKLCKTIKTLLKRDPAVKALLINQQDQRNKNRKKGIKYDRKIKQLEKLYIERAPDFTLHAILFYEKLSNTSCTFIFLYLYFLKENYMKNLNEAKNDTSFDNTIVESLDLNEIGKIFKIYLFVLMLKKRPTKGEYGFLPYELFHIFFNNSYTGSNIFSHKFYESLEKFVKKVDLEHGTPNN